VEKEVFRWRGMIDRGTCKGRKEEEEERSLIKDLKRYAQLAVAWDRHGSLGPSGGDMRIKE